MPPGPPARRPKVASTARAGAQVIGDGAITGGMAYEAMNHAGFLDKNMIVILNDNQQVGGGAGTRSWLPAEVEGAGGGCSWEGRSMQ